MSPKEKAVELFDKFSLCYYHAPNAKQCAIIAVDEILIARPCAPFCISTDSGSSEALIDANNFWIIVKIEIERL